MHSSVVFSRTARKSETLVPIIEETFEAGRCEHNVETAERGVERPGSCASAVAGRTARDTAQLPAASSMPADRRAQVLRPIEMVAAVCDEPAPEVLVISAPRLRLGVLDDLSSSRGPRSSKDTNSCAPRIDVDHRKSRDAPCRSWHYEWTVLEPRNMSAALPTRSWRQPPPDISERNVRRPHADL